MKEPFGVDLAEMPIPVPSPCEADRKSRAAMAPDLVKVLDCLLLCWELVGKSLELMGLSMGARWGY